ncbi:MAG: NAD(P)H-binding protein [Bacteroidetes bacterium]|nr:NAD(P)H-binding protein [Bacteroidota bacterium]
MRDIRADAIGVTGQTGKLVMKQILDDHAFSSLRILVRRPYELQEPKLEMVLVDFNNLPELKNAIGMGDTIFSCIGTTMKQVKGDKALYRTIDFDINVNVAKLALDNGFTRFILMSAVGTNPSSSNFYLRLKGETEAAIAAMPFEAVHIMQPSMLLGQREQHRTGEKFAKNISKAISPLLLGAMGKYRPIESSMVATAMIAASKLPVKGVHRYGYREMMGLIQASK